ncbi:MAG: HAD family hydrolase, partial [Firmicutes bacterium]|nr:HAD family hydrolase [Bacillota bacterium]
MTKSSVQTLLFDLDGTLIKLDMNTFLPHYFRALGSYFA